MQLSVTLSFFTVPLSKMNMACLSFQGSVADYCCCKSYRFSVRSLTKKWNQSTWWAACSLTMHDGDPDSLVNPKRVCVGWSELSGIMAMDVSKRKQPRGEHFMAEVTYRCQKNGTRRVAKISLGVRITAS